LELLAAEPEGEDHRARRARRDDELLAEGGDAARDPGEELERLAGRAARKVPVPGRRTAAGSAGVLVFVGQTHEPVGRLAGGVGAAGDRGGERRDLNPVATAEVAKAARRGPAHLGALAEGDEDVRAPRLEPELTLGLAPVEQVRAVEVDHGRDQLRLPASLH